MIKQDETQVCSDCGTEKPITDYYRTNSTKNQRRSMCKVCYKATAWATRKHNNDVRGGEWVQIPTDTDIYLDRYQRLQVITDRIRLEMGMPRVRIEPTTPGELANFIEEPHADNTTTTTEGAVAEQEVALHGQGEGCEGIPVYRLLYGD